MVNHKLVSRIVDKLLETEKTADKPKEGKPEEKEDEPKPRVDRTSNDYLANEQDRWDHEYDSRSGRT